MMTQILPEPSKFVMDRFIRYDRASPVRRPLTPSESVESALNLTDPIHGVRYSAVVWGFRHVRGARIYLRTLLSKRVEIVVRADQMRRRSGFTLVELVVVVMIIGILVAIAAPKMLNITGEATDNSVRMSLNVIRDAVETYASQNAGSYPDDTNDAAFKAAIKPYLRGVFPASLVGTKDNTVTMSAADPVVADNTTGWMYNGTTGEFVLNSTTISKDGSTAYSAF